MATSVVGIDLGNYKTVISVARNRAIDVIVNEVFNRSTPTLVGFGPKSRYLGEAAKTQEISNYKNTVANMKQLVGRMAKDSDIEAEKEFLFCELVETDGELLAQVNYAGKEQAFTFTQLLAMYFTRIKQIAELELKTPVNDVVISCSGWFKDIQRTCLMSAAEIAGLNPLRIINDVTAAALGYGITKSDLPEDEPRNVVLVDMGHANLTVSVAAFIKGQLTILASAFDRQLGGRDIDMIITKHFAEEFKTKYKIDIMKNPKAKLRLLNGVEKLKKVLSANAAAPLNIESIMNDIDVSGLLHREDFERLISPLLQRIKAPLEAVLKETKLTNDQIYSVELIGGSTRIPSVKQAIADFFKKPLSFTMNQDEAVAKGCGFACAIMSPLFRVRDFVVHDINQYPIEFSWEPCDENPEEETSIEVFEHNNPVPSTKILSFYRSKPFTVTCSYKYPNFIPGNMNPWIGDFRINDVKPQENGEPSLVKVKLRLNVNGVVTVDQAMIISEKETEEVKAEADQTNENESTETNEDKEMRDEEPTKKFRKIQEKTPLSITSSTHKMEASSLEKFREQEMAMLVEEKLIAETDDRKNTLEEYIYDMRGKIDDLYANFVQPNEKEKLLKLLDQTEDWLYDEGVDATKSVYIAKLDDLLKIGGPIKQRYLDFEEQKRQEILKAQKEKNESEQTENTNDAMEKEGSTPESENILD